MCVCMSVLLQKDKAREIERRSISLLKTKIRHTLSARVHRNAQGLSQTRTSRDLWLNGDWSLFHVSLCVTFTHRLAKCVPLSTRPPPPRSTFQPHAHSLFPDIAHCLATSKGSILNMCPFKTVQEFIASGPHYVSLLNRSHVAALIRTYMYLQCRQSTYLRGVQIRMQAAFDNLAAGKCCTVRYVHECTRGLISQCKKSSNLF